MLCDGSFCFSLDALWRIGIGVPESLSTSQGFAGTEFFVRRAIVHSFIHRLDQWHLRASMSVVDYRYVTGCRDLDCWTDIV